MKLIYAVALFENVSVFWYFDALVKPFRCVIHFYTIINIMFWHVNLMPPAMIFILKNIQWGYIFIRILSNCQYVAFWLKS